jgi:hypothetical protein
MAQVPNYYYNSPWIADAARSFASALAPPDPDKLREREQKRFEFDYLKTKASNEEIDRERKLKGDEVWGKMFRLRANPILGADGKTDVKATDDEAYRLADEAASYGVDRQDIDAGLMEASWSFRRKKIAQQLAIQAAATRMALQNSGAMDRLNTQGTIVSQLQAQKDFEEMERLKVSIGGKLQEWTIRANAAANKNGQPPITITESLSEEIVRQWNRYESITGSKATTAEKLLAIGDISELTQTLRNPIAATEKVFETKFPGALRGAQVRTREVVDPNSYINDILSLVDADPRVHQTVLDPVSSPVAPGSAEDLSTNPLNWGAAATTTPAPVNPFVRQPAHTEDEMTRLSNEAAAAENAALPVTGKKPAQRTPNGQPKETPEQRKARLRRLLQGGQ